MKHRLSLLILLIGALLVTGCQPAAAPEPTEAPEAENESVLEVVGLDGSSKALTLSELQALPAYEGWGGTMSSTGRITPPATFKGVTVEELCDLVGGLEEGMAVRIVAEDGYAMTISYDQIATGDFTVYDPGTGEETTTDDRLRVVLAYEREGEPLPAKEEGTLRMIMLNDDNSQVIDGHWAVKWVNQIAIKSLAEEWVLHLEGAITEDMDRNTFESGASAHCHLATWEDDHAQTWEGIPLWLLVGRVDDENKHEGQAFNREVADAGYTVDVVAADGYTVSLDSARIKENDNMIVAYLVNENPLDEGDFPLRLVGDDLEKSEMVGQIAQILVNFSETAEATEEPTPEAAEEAVEEAILLPECDGALAIAGAVAESQCWTEEEIQAMERVAVTVEHPKKGEQNYEGLRINDLLALAQPTEEASALVLTASDGYSAEISLEDMQACEDCLLACDEEGGLNAALSGFDDTALWVKDVVLIAVK